MRAQAGLAPGNAYRHHPAMDIRAHNRAAWDRYVELENRWTVPVTRQDVEEARQGRWEVLLTPTRPVPRSWFPPLKDLDLLCLASAGGQQGPLLAAAGARVTVLDNSPAQLEQDGRVADESGLDMTLVEGDMCALDALEPGSFDLVFHPVSNCFVDRLDPVWRGVSRVLRPGGALLYGFTNPVLFLFDEEDLEKGGPLVASHKVPYSDVEILTPEQLQRYQEQGEALEFGHTMEDQIGGLLERGFHLSGLYEDNFPEGEHPLAGVIPCFTAAWAVRT